MFHTLFVITQLFTTQDLNNQQIQVVFCHFLYNYHIIYYSQLDQIPRQNILKETIINIKTLHYKIKAFHLNSIKSVRFNAHYFLYYLEKSRISFNHAQQNIKCNDLIFHHAQLNHFPNNSFQQILRSWHESQIKHLIY